MKKFLLTFIFFCFFLISPSHAFGQTFDFKRAYDDYLYNFNLYRQTHLEYTSAKSEYYAYQTLESETRALEKTRALLFTRNAALATYLTALRMKLVETTNVINYEQSMRFIYLDNQISFLKLNDQKLPAPATIDDLQIVSNEVADKYPEIEILAYQTLTTINAGQVEGLTSRLEVEVKKLEEKIDEARNLGEDTTTVERWLLNVKEKIVLAKRKREEAKNLISTLVPKEQNKKAVWASSQQLSEEANQYLKEAVSYTKEIIKKLKYG